MINQVTKKSLMNKCCVGGFAWVGSAKNNQQNITFYLGNIAYE